MQWQASEKARNEELSFLDLPRELRDHVYGFLLKTPDALVAGKRRNRSRGGSTAFRSSHVSSRKISYRSFSDFDKRAYRFIWKIPCGGTLDGTILLTSHQVHYEASKVVYSNVILFHRPFNLTKDDVTLLHRTIPASYAPFVQQLNLVVDLGNREILTWFCHEGYPQLKGNFTGLRDFTLRIVLGRNFCSRYGLPLDYVARNASPKQISDRIHHWMEDIFGPNNLCVPNSLHVKLNCHSDHERMFDEAWKRVTSQDCETNG